MASTNLENYYQEVGDDYRMSSTRRRKVFNMLNSAIDKVKSSPVRILDIGIGSGEVGTYCRRYNNRQLETTGVDVSSGLLQKYRSFYDHLILANVDGSDWAQKVTASYDIAVISEILEHLFRPDIFLRELSRVIVPGGFVAVSTPNLLLWSQRLKFLLGRHEYSDKGRFQWGHIRLMSWPYLRRIFNDCGFTLVDADHVVHPKSLDPWRRLAPGLLAFQFVFLAQKKS